MAQDNDIQRLIRDECNITNDANVAANIPVIWSMYADKGQLLQYHYTRRHVLGYLLGQLRSKVDTQIGNDKISASQKFKQVLNMFQDEQSMILLIDAESFAATLHSSTPVSTLPSAFDDQLKALQSGLIAPDVWNGMFRIPGIF